MLTAGFSLLKSLGKSATKRKRDGDEESPGDPETDSATKRARMPSAGGNPAGASFITSAQCCTLRGCIGCFIAGNAAMCAHVQDGRGRAVAQARQVCEKGAILILLGPSQLPCEPSRRSHRQPL